jgi:tetratricopeptide (TPR) repeat protein
LRVALATSLDQAESRDAGLRLRLRLSDAPELADLPWEYLYNRSARRFLALSEWTPVVRYLEFPGRVRPLAVRPPLRVLVLIASPTDFPPLDTNAEWEKLREALGDLQLAGRVLVDRVPTGTLADLQRRLRRDDYHVFHYIGHGGYDPQVDDGVLVLEGANGRGQQVSGQDLGVLLHDHRTLRLAVLNSCEGARGGRTDPYSGTAQSLVRQGIPAVVAMQFEITDTAAIAFARSLYEAVADGYPLDAAMAEARKAVRHQPNPVEWGTPVLYLRSPDGRIFDVPSGSALTGPAPEQAARPDAPIAESAALTEPYDDPEYTAALAAFFTERWDAAVDLLTRVLTRHPDFPQAADRLAEARRRRQLADWDAEAGQAAEQGRWAAAVAALERVAAAQPDQPDIARRLEQARSQLTITSLQDDLRRMYTARQWPAVIALGEQLDALDPRLADPDGLVTAARAELAEAELADRYNAGLLQLDRGDRAVAADTFAAILSERPGYRDAAALLARAREDQAAQPTAEQQPPREQVPAAPRPEPTHDQETSAKTPRPPSGRQRWLATSALVTGGLVFAAWTSEGIATEASLLGLVIGLVTALPFLVGWWLLRSRPRIGAAVIGIFAAIWAIAAIVGLNSPGAAVLTYVFAALSIPPAVTAAVQSVRVIRSPEK